MSTSAYPFPSVAPSVYPFPSVAPSAYPLPSVAYRWVCPNAGPAADPAALLRWALPELSATQDAIYCAQRDYPALAATLLAPRVALPPHGVVQPGTLYLVEDVAA